MNNSLHNDERVFESLQTLILNRCGLQMDDKKKDLAFLRIQKRLVDFGVQTMGDYLKKLQKKENESEFQALVDEVTTRHTLFFRENSQLDYLRETILPIIERTLKRQSDRKIRIWSAGCSSGEEAYTLAMMMLEQFGEGWDIRILASDICHKALSKAHQGIYPEKVVQSIPLRLRTYYFEKKTESGHVYFRAKESLRTLIQFREINFMDSRFPINTLFDLIFCRNVIIYFDQETRNRLILRFKGYLKKDQGYLCLGHSEVIPSISDLKKWKFNIHQKIGL